MKRATFAVIFAAVLAVSETSAHEPDSYGFGSRGAAMAGAVAADVSDFSSTYYNPAGLVGARGVELSMGYIAAHNGLLINDQDSDVDPVRGLVGGLVVPGKVFGLPFAIGVATYLPDKGLSHIEARRQEVPRWELYDTRPSLIFLATNLAIQPVSWLQVGGGVAYLAATRGRFGIRGQADVLHPYDSQLEHEVDADLTSIRYPQAGVRVTLPHVGALGLVYRGETKLDLALDAHLDGAVTFSGIDVPLTYDLESRTIDAFLPQQVVLGASFQGVERLHVNLDVTWVNWSAYESPTAKTKAHLDAIPPPGLDIDLPDDPKPTVVIPPAFEDRFVPRIGMEYEVPVAGAFRRPHGSDQDVRLVEIPIRLGYAYESSPVPPQTGFTNFVDADRHTLTFGTGVTLNAPSEEMMGSVHLDVHLSWSILPERVTEKLSASDFVGDYVARGNMLGGGATLRAVF